MSSYIIQPDGTFPSVCPLDYPDQCGLLVHKKDGKIIKIEGDPNQTQAGEKLVLSILMNGISEVPS